jgi:hypothetical protein
MNRLNEELNQKSIYELTLSIKEIKIECCVELRMRSTFPEEASQQFTKT